MTDIVISMMAWCSSLPSRHHRHAVSLAGPAVHAMASAIQLPSTVAGAPTWRRAASRRMVCSAADTSPMPSCTYITRAHSSGSSPRSLRSQSSHRRAAMNSFCLRQGREADTYAHASGTAEHSEPVQPSEAAEGRLSAPISCMYCPTEQYPQQQLPGAALELRTSHPAACRVCLHGQLDAAATQFGPQAPLTPPAGRGEHHRACYPLPGCWPWHSTHRAWLLTRAEAQ